MSLIDAIDHSQKRSSRATSSFWRVVCRRDSAKSCQTALGQLLRRFIAASPLNLFEAVEAGVPMRMVGLIARATGIAGSEVAVVVGLSSRVSRDRQWSDDIMPELTAHRLVGLLHVMANVRRLLCESAEFESCGDANVEVWVMRWVQAKSPELGGLKPADMLCNLDGQRAVEKLLARMRGGLPA